MLVLLYHNVLTQPMPGLPVTAYQVSLALFEQQIARLRDQILHPREVEEQLLKGRQPRGVLVTFDDGAAGIVEAGQVLASVGKQGVAFVCPDACQRGLWFYRLVEAVIHTSVETITWRGKTLPLVTPKEKVAAYRVFSPALFSMDPAARDAELVEIVRLLQPVAAPPCAALTILDQDGLARAAQTGGLLLGNHSWSHTDLSSVSEPVVRQEVEQAAAWLAGSGLPTISWFAFPRGRYDETTLKIVREFHPLCFGADARESIKQVIPRTPINSLDANRWRFAAKTSWQGWFYKNVIRSAQTWINAVQPMVF
jgi:hypothetical protein